MFSNIFFWLENKICLHLQFVVVQMLFFFLIYFQPNARGKQQQQLATFNVISVFFRPSLLVGTSILFLIHPPSSIEISENILKKNWKNFLVIQNSVIHFEWLLHCLIPSFFPETFPTLFLLAIRIISILLFLSFRFLVKFAALYVI